MPAFTNQATLRYNDTVTNSNIVTGEVVGVLSATKTALTQSYTTGESITYVVSIVNSGATAYTGLTLSDDLGGYAFGEADPTTLYPLSYTAGSVLYLQNGVTQAAPTVTAGPPLQFGGITVPAGGNATLIYQTTANAYAPLATESEVTNTVSLTGGGLLAPVTASETVAARSAATLGITKGISPVPVAENGQLTYTFVISNSGSLAATADEQVVMSDTFAPILNPLTVTLDGQLLTEGTHYTYDTTTGAFATLPGQITVPAATYTQATDGTWIVTPGVATLVITGTV